MKKHWLYNSTVVVTGASGGLGFSIAKLLIEKYDCKVYGIARNKEKIEKSILSLGEKKSNFSYKLFDVSVKENWLDFKNYLIENNIGVDVLINNAGYMLPFSKFGDLPPSETDSIIATNFNACCYSINALLPIISKSKNPAIINISSSAGLCPVIGESLYVASKFALRGFTETIMQEYKNIYIGGVYPGFIKTDILSKVDKSSRDEKLIGKVMMSLPKATKKIVKRIAKRKRKTVTGLDGKFMYYGYKISPKFTGFLIKTVLKKSKLDMFRDLFE